MLMPERDENQDCPAGWTLRKRYLISVALDESALGVAEKGTNICQSHFFKKKAWSKHDGKHILPTAPAAPMLRNQLKYMNWSSLQESHQPSHCSSRTRVNSRLVFHGNSNRSAPHSA